MTRRTIESSSLESKILDEIRPLLISKPVNYDKSSEHYFVVYVLDGNLNTAFTSGIAELLYQSGYPKLLIVGIPNTFRSRDLTPSADDEAASGGGSDLFLSFLADELIPYIDKHFRTLPYRVLIGHSFGGLFATYSLYQKNNPFNAMIAITPSVFYDQELVINELFKNLDNKNQIKSSYFFSVAHEPGIEGDAVFKFRNLLQKSNVTQFDWDFKYYPNENHSTTPLIATLDGLRYVFKELVLSDSIIQVRGLKHLISYYEGLKEKFNVEIEIPQRSLMIYGYFLMEQKQNKMAIDVFKHYVKRYPKMIAPYDALSVIYERSGKKELAVLELKKLLSILPGYKDAQIRLKRLLD